MNFKETVGQQSKIKFEVFFGVFLFCFTAIKLSLTGQQTQKGRIGLSADLFD